jgi:hypothetical protein
MVRRFTCSHCGGTFIQGWSEQEAVAEAKALFPESDVTDSNEVCDPCYEKFLAWMKAKTVRS